MADVRGCDVLVEYFDSWQRTPEKKAKGTHLIKRDNFPFTHLISQQLSEGNISILDLQRRTLRFREVKYVSLAHAA